MDPVLPLHPFQIHEAQIGFVQQRRGLQGIAAFLAHHVLVSQPVQLPVDQRHQLVKRPLIAATPFVKQQGDVSPGTAVQRILSSEK